ncbi:hypothetical protein DRN62_04195, partial [Nanoarchaeota archaeon]
MKRAFLREEKIFLLLLFSSFNILILLFAKEWPNYIGYDVFLSSTPPTRLALLESFLFSLPFGPIVQVFSFLFGLVFMYPLASRLTRDSLIFLILTISLSLCTLTILLFTMGALGLGLYLFPTLLLCLMLYLIQRALFRVRTFKFTVPELGLLEKATFSLIILVLSLLSFRTLYFPFIAADTLGRYGIEAKFMYLSRRLMSLNDYPLLIPLSYLYTYLCFGGVNEHLAKIIDVIFTWMMVSSVYLFGKSLFNRKVGFLSALSFCLFSWFAVGDPLSLSYDGLEALDIPSTFFFTTSLLFFLLYLMEKREELATLSGVMLGIGLWCKHSLLISFPSFFLLAAVMSLHRKEGNIARGFLVILLFSLVICLSFYASNLRFRGYLYEQITYVDTQFYNPIKLPQIISNALMHREKLVFFFFLSLPIALKKHRVKTLTILLSILPIFLYWALVYAKVPRYLLLISAPLSVFPGLFFEELAKKEIEMFFLIILFLLPESLYLSAGREFFVRIVNDPFMSEDEKRSLVLGDLYELAKFLKENTTGGVYLAGDSLLASYFLENRKFGGWVPKGMW